MVYHKVVKQQYGEKLLHQFNNLLQNDLNVIVKFCLPPSVNAERVP